MFGTDLLVAPLMEETPGRDVYLPPGRWTDYGSGEVYEGGWRSIRAGEVPIVVLVREGAAVPHARLAASTDDMDWSRIDLRVYGGVSSAEGYFCLPDDEVHEVRVESRDGHLAVVDDPLDGRVGWELRAVHV